jgi:hypothetical protein
MATAAIATSTSARSASFCLSIPLLPDGYGAAAQAVLVALPDFLPDVALDPIERLLRELLRLALLVLPQQWSQDVVVGPSVELGHVIYLLFGHCFVPFGKLEFFGSGQLALLAARMEAAAWVPDPVKAPPPARPFDGLPWRGLDRSGWPLHFKNREQGKPHHFESAGGTACKSWAGAWGGNAKFLFLPPGPKGPLVWFS